MSKSSPVQASSPQSARLQAALAELLRSPLAPEEFRRQWLSRLVEGAAAVGGRLRRPSAEGTLGSEAEHNFAVRPSDDAAADPAGYERFVLEAYAKGRPRVIAPRGADRDDARTNPTDGLLILAPLTLDGELGGVIELILPVDVSPEAQRDALQACAAASTAFGEYQRRRQARALAARQTLVDEVERFTRTIHEKLDVRRTAYVAANDGRRLIGCDRLSVLLRRGRRYDVLAAAGVDDVQPRSQAAKLLGRLAAVVAETGEAVWFGGAADDLSPQLRQALAKYVDHTHVKQVAVVPLMPPADERQPSQKRPRPIGALVVEQIEDVTPSAGREERAKLVALHTTTALTKALEHEAIPLLPVWRALRGVTRLFAPGTRLKTAAVIVLLVAAAAALKFIPAELALSARGELQPAVRRHVFAPLDATVKRIHVGHGDRVAAGQLLVELRNTDLDVALADTVGRRTAAQEQLLAVERSLYEDNTRIGVEERHRLAGQRSELKQRLVALDEELRLLRRKREQLAVVSPIAGEVTTWNVEELLRDRPVRQGQVLIDVADTAGPWELELQIPEDGIGHVLAAQEEQGAALRVTYRPAAEPSIDRTAELSEVHFAAEVRGEEGNTVLAKATLTGDALPALRPGAEAAAKVYCGTRALGYVWLHDAVDFVRTKVWFRMY
jgi:multidrug efflux pump subunit AcrA (membrane-fusion protein)